MILKVTMHDKSNQLVNMENVCSISPALVTDPSVCHTVFVMANGFRLCVREKFEDVAETLGVKL